MSCWIMRAMTIGLVLAATAGPAAAAVTFEGASHDLSASATFDIVDSKLKVTLTNTSKADVLIENDVLSAVFFDIARNPTLTPLSAVLNDGSTVVHAPQWRGSTDPGGVVGGEWAYRSDLPRTDVPASQVISSVAGEDVFGPEHFFPGSNLQGPSSSPDGLHYGLTSAEDDLTTGCSAVTGGKCWDPVSLIRNSVVFTLGSLPLGFALDDISNVHFNYSRGLDTIPSTAQCGGIIPEPASLAVWGMLAVVGLVAGCRRRKRQKTTE